jgi:hypothetical protein
MYKFNNLNNEKVNPSLILNKILDQVLVINDRAIFKGFVGVVGLLDTVKEEGFKASLKERAAVDT